MKEPAYASTLAFWTAAALSLHPQVSAGGALLLGIAVALAFGNPYPAEAKAVSAKLLMWSVMGLGAGMQLGPVMKAGLQGVGYTAVGIAATLGLGAWLARRLAVDEDTGLLINVGTSICGGSAIAAAASTIKAKPHQISISLAAVFLLNAAALLIFPPIGRRLGLTEPQFGLWAALAIHDTSSVVGASMQYGREALALATPVKLARALWIVPLTLGIGALRARKAQDGSSTAKPKRPWFILGFLLAAALVTWLPALAPAGLWIATAARRALVVTLFLIGTGISREALRAVGARPLIQAVLLWACVASATLAAVCAGFIRPPA